MTKSDGPKYGLGDTVKDTITSFEGVVYSSTEWYNGSRRYGLWRRELDKDNNVVKLDFDEAQLELVAKGPAREPVPFRFNLGDKVKDDLTGFDGKIFARTEWFNGCTRYEVQATHLDRNGKVIQEGFDENQLVLMAEPARSPVKEKRTGGPFGEPSRSRLSR